MDIEKLHNKKFKIFGSTWTIKIVDSIGEETKDGATKEGDYDDKGCIYAGLSSCAEGSVKIARKLSGVKVTNEFMFNTLCHELTHAILDTGGYNKETYDEQLVEFIGRGMAELVRQNILYK